MGLGKGERTCISEEGVSKEAKQGHGKKKGGRVK